MKLRGTLIHWEIVKDAPFLYHLEGEVLTWSSGEFQPGKIIRTGSIVRLDETGEYVYTITSCFKIVPKYEPKQDNNKSKTTVSQSSMLF